MKTPSRDACIDIHKIILTTIWTSLSPLNLRHKVNNPTSNGYVCSKGPKSKSASDRLPCLKSWLVNLKGTLYCTHAVFSLRPWRSGDNKCHNEYTNMARMKLFDGVLGQFPSCLHQIWALLLTRQYLVKTWTSLFFISRQTEDVKICWALESVNFNNTIITIYLPYPPSSPSITMDRLRQP
jgi:hypothetical protein